MRNLDPERTIILNTERKQLPFRGALKFTMNQYLEDWAAFFKTFNKALESDKADVIIIESFTSLAEMVYKKANDTFQGFDVWNDYKTKIGDILSMSKNTNKYVIFIGIDMTIDGANGVEERCVGFSDVCDEGDQEFEQRQRCVCSNPATSVHLCRGTDLQGQLHRYRRGLLEGEWRRRVGRCVWARAGNRSGSSAPMGAVDL